MLLYLDLDTITTEKEALECTKELRKEIIMACNSRSNKFNEIRRVQDMTNVMRMHCLDNDWMEPLKDLKKMFLKLERSSAKELGSMLGLER